MPDHGAVSQEVTTAHLVCFSHLRWAFVTQRPQHLLRRAARSMRVIYWEEPIWEEGALPTVRVHRTDEGIIVAQPVVAWWTEWEDVLRLQRTLLDGLLRDEAVTNPILWYYTPMALDFSDHLQGRPIVYDCMDELSAFAGADPAIATRERELLRRADLVFTGGVSLFEAKRALHPDVHAFPSGVDVEHFRSARSGLAEPADQAVIPHPRVGFFGVIDERLDRTLLDAAAELRPDLQFVLIGPIVKLDLDELPRRANLHYLGARDYADLPAYIAHWDVAMLPFALNEATRFISPTKTPEYLASGCPVVATPVRDVVRIWGETPYVRIANDAASFVREIEHLRALPALWQDAADARLRQMSWDRTWQEMATLIAGTRKPKQFSITGRLHYDHLIVGAGFAGAVLAERLAAGAGKRVLVIDRRPHIGGNAFDRRDAAGLLIHPFGPHIFHTNSQQVFDYLSRFTAWRPYAHRVLAKVGEQLLPMPINRTTVNAFFGLALTEAEMGPFLASKAVRHGPVRTAADGVLAIVGRELYDALFRFYTQKQWGRDASQLDKSVTARLPVRTNDDDRYFTDRYQVMPAHGYTKMFEAMLDHPNIDVSLGTDLAEVSASTYDHLVYSGPIDAYFGLRFGKLPYRSLEFRHETLDCERVQPVAVINYPTLDVPYTRVTEFKHMTGDVSAKTSLCYEYPTDIGDPYYPVPCSENAALYRRYRSLADQIERVAFVGRLATYQYLNMDQVVGQALATFDRLTARDTEVPTTIGVAAAD